MKFIQFSDLHIQKHSLSGKDGWGRVFQCCNVLKEIASNTDVDFVLFCGDLFHDKKPDLDVWEYVMALFATKPFRRVPWYFIAGQHDWRDRPYGTSNYDNFVTMSEAGDVYSNFKVFLKTETDCVSGLGLEDTLSLGLTEIPYGDKQKTDLKELFSTSYIFEKSILAIHTPVVDYPMTSSVRSTVGLTIKELCDGKHNYTAVGDFHEFNIGYQDGKKIVMCGSPVQHTFGESINGHGYCIVDTNGFSVKRKVNNSYDKMITIKVEPNTTRENLDMILRVFNNKNIIFRFVVEDRGNLSMVDTAWKCWQEDHESEKGYKIQIVKGSKTIVEMDEGNKPDASFNLENEIQKHIDSLGLSPVDVSKLQSLSVEILSRAGVSQ